VREDKVYDSGKKPQVWGGSAGNCLHFHNNQLNH
jgi:hypothetical protein